MTSPVYKWLKVVQLLNGLDVHLLLGVGASRALVSPCEDTYGVSDALLAYLGVFAPPKKNPGGCTMILVCLSLVSKQILNDYQ